MGDTVLGKPYGLTHEDMLKAHHLFVSTVGNTPYQLDLEVKDRKPDIIPKVGDKVKIKSLEWFKKWQGPEGWVSFYTTGCCFVKDMTKLCGKTFTVSNVKDTDIDGKRWCLASQAYYFVPEMFEEVYPQASLEGLRAKWGLNKEPELQTIKRHRFIKLEKL